MIASYIARLGGVKKYLMLGRALDSMARKSLYSTGLRCQSTIAQIPHRTAPPAGWPPTRSHPVVCTPPTILQPRITLEFLIHILTLPKLWKLSANFVGTRTSMSRVVASADRRLGVRPGRGLH